MNRSTYTTQLKLARRSHEMLVLVLAVCCLAGGCQRDPYERVAVEGTVEFDGSPLAWGTVLFTPTAGTTGPRAVGMIEDGSFSLPRETGPVVGRHRVQIWSEHSPDAAHDIKRETPLPPTVDIPPRYNQRTTLEVEATALGPNQYRFQLLSKP